MKYILGTPSRNSPTPISTHTSHAPLESLAQNIAKIKTNWTFLSLKKSHTHPVTTKTNLPRCYWNVV